MYVSIINNLVLSLYRKLTGRFLQAGKWKMFKYSIFCIINIIVLSHKSCFLKFIITTKIIFHIFTFQRKQVSIFSVSVILTITFFIVNLNFINTQLRYKNNNEPIRKFHIFLYYATSDVYIYLNSRLNDLSLNKKIYMFGSSKPCLRDTYDILYILFVSHLNTD